MHPPRKIGEPWNLIHTAAGRPPAVVALVLSIMQRSASFTCSFAAVVGLLAGAVTAVAQPLQLPGVDQVNAVGELGGLGGKARFEASLQLDDDGQRGTLTVSGVVAPQWHIYSLTQQSGGPIKTTIRLDDGSQVKLLGEFEAVTKPHEGFDEIAFPGLPIESHEGRVEWTAPVEVTATGLDGAVSVRGSVRYQACREGQCLPPTRASFEASVESVGPSVEAVPASADFSAEGVAWRVSASSLVVAPGGTIDLEFAATPDADWHIYEREQVVDPEKLGYKPTLIAFAATGGMEYSAPVTAARLIEDEQDFGVGKITLRYYEGATSWNVRLQAPQDAPPGVQEISGAVGYLACSGAQCKMPVAFSFRIPVTVGDAPAAEARTIALTETRYGDAASAAESAPAATLQPPAPPASPPTSPAGGGAPIAVADSPFAPVLLNAKDHSVWGWLVLAFFEGLILNIMPCVLPVVGLKVYSFIEQAGHNRWKAFQLNLWYTLGMLCVFWLLAIAAAFLGQGWGAQFENEAFKITLIAVVFVFGLSFLGVWELPIPGFAATTTATGLSTKEGASGAYFKGVFSTVLATPLRRSAARYDSRLGAHAVDADDLRDLHGRRPRHGVALPRARRVPAARQVPPAPRSLDGRL